MFLSVAEKIAGDARKKLEIETGRKVITSKNYLPAQKTVKLTI